MASPRRESEAVALSSVDLPHEPELLLHSCEDCACPVSGYESGPNMAGLTPTDAMTDLNRWVCGHEVLAIRVDSEHTVLFNPVGHGGIVVVNDLAYQIFNRFKRPTRPGDALKDWVGRSDHVAQVFSRLSQQGVIHPTGKIPSPEFQESRVLTAWLHVTNACNLRCPYCYIHKSAEGMDEPVGRAAIEALIRSAIEHGFGAVKLKYAGGEASLNHRLMVKLQAFARERAAGHGLQLLGTLLSNGVALPRTLVDTLKAEGIKVMISLDGVGEQHDVQRPFVNGRPSFALVERTIAQLIDQKHAPHLSITITNRNASGLADVVRFALERDLSFSLNFFRDNDCAASFADLQYDEQVMISAVLQAFTVIEEIMPRWSVLGSILDRGQLLQPRQRSCGVGQDYVVIDQRGRVAKCHMEIERTIGDVFRDDPLQLVRTDTSSALNLAVHEKEGCRGCTWRYWCSGGCTVATFRATGRYDIKSPNCNIYKAIYPEALKLEGLRVLKYAPRPVRLTSGLPLRLVSDVSDEERWSVPVTAESPACGSAGAGRFRP